MLCYAKYAIIYCIPVRSLNRAIYDGHKLLQNDNHNAENVKY